MRLAIAPPLIGSSEVFQTLLALWAAFQVGQRSTVTVDIFL
jgi:hypothetical protein